MEILLGRKISNMGATISVVCRSEALATKLLNVINENIKDCAKIALSEEEFNNFYHDEFLCYEKNTLGIKISSASGSAYELLIAIVRWAAIKGGRKQKSFPEVGKFDVAVPYTRYDDFENWPILLEKPKLEKHMWCYFDEFGTHKYIKHNTKMWDAYFILNYKEIVYGTKSYLGHDQIWNNFPEYRKYCKEQNKKIKKAIKLLNEKYEAIK